MTICYQEQDGTAVPIFKGKYGKARLSRNVGKELPLHAARREQFSRHIVIFSGFCKRVRSTKHRMKLDARKRAMNLRG
jgi:hypothetical protein